MCASVRVCVALHANLISHVTPRLFRRSASGRVDCAQTCVFHLCLFDVFDLLVGCVERMGVGGVEG